MIKDVFLAGGVRTPLGGMSGVLSEVSAATLGGIVIKTAFQRAGVPADKVDEVIMGNVVSAGLGQNVARQAMRAAGLPDSVGAISVNKVCGSGLKAVMLAAQAIQCEDSGVVVAGGTESMSQAPYILKKARAGYRMGNGELIDAMVNDGLWDVYQNKHMGVYGDQCATKYGFTRQMQDDFAVESAKRAIKATADGVFAQEIVPVQAPSGKTTVTVSEDENLKRFNEEKLRQLRPAFDKAGTVTAGNASSISDGAAACVVLSAAKVAEFKVKPQAQILGYATHSQAPEWFTTAPGGAILKLMKALNLTVKDVGLFEINEAFCTVTMAAMKDVGIPHDKVNVLGGAAAIGHPIGASGARTLVTLLNAMKQRGAKIGIDALCIGGGEAVAMAVQLC